jgi:dihydrofolate reductase
LAWNATAVAGDAAETVARLKRGDGGPVIMYASFLLLRTLLLRGLVDELNLGVHPLVLGEGRRLFDGALPHPLRLVAATPSETGVVTLTYAQ